MQKIQGIKGYLAASKDDYYIKSQFKGEVVDKLIRWPKELGTEHPFNFEDTEKVYKTFGLINGGINKITNNIVGEFSVEAENPNVAELVNDFIKENNFSVVLREWIRESLIKGNGFMEVDAKAGKVRVLNSNNMYVIRDKKGNVTGYNQYVGNLERLNLRKVIPFQVNQIAHLKINCISDDAYGMGLIMPNERVIENIILGEQDKSKLISRKAGAPIHVSVGQPGENANVEAINSFKTDLQYMNNRTEWVTDGNVKMEIIQFGDIGKNITDSIMYDFRQLIAGFGIPEVMLNSGQLNEGIAKVQLEGWQRDIINYQDMIEGVIISKIINPYLEGQGLKGDVDFIWRLPGESEVNARLEKLNMILSNMAISENMKRIVQLEIARLLGIENADELLIQPEPGVDEEQQVMKDDLKKAEVEGAGIENEGKEVDNKEREKEAKMPLPKVPGAKAMQESINFAEMTIKEFVNLQEIKGFNYSDYLIAILKRLKIDEFTDLRAITEQQIKDGLLPESDINKLRTILKEGFKNNQSMKDIELSIKERIDLKDRITENGSTIPAITRPEMIARTEVIRVSNESLIDLFKDNGIEKKRWLAAISDRTCENCLALDGQIVKINESFNSSLGDVQTPPLHPQCRCSIISE